MKTTMLFSLFLLCCIASLQQVYAQASRQHIFNPDSVMQQPPIHDPVMIKAENKYYLFYTGMLVPTYVSDDGVNWKSGKPVFKVAPEWAVRDVPGYHGHTWAPDILFHKGLFHLFYSCSTFGKNRSAIGHATSKALDTISEDYGWIDHGKIIQSVPSRDDWNAIDANVIIADNGTPWLCFGSFWSGIKMVKLDSLLNAVAQPEEWYTLSRREISIANGGASNSAVEAPFIYQHGNYYYLFVSFDMCCKGVESTYKVVVGRSQSVIGPYYDKRGVDMALGGGSLLIAGDSVKYYGVGHCGVCRIDDKDLFVAHGYSVSHKGKSELLIKELNWDIDGWPMLVP